MPTPLGTAVKGRSAGGTTLTFSITVPATGARRGLGVGAGAFAGSGTIDSVTANGTPVPKRGSTFGTIGTEGISEGYFLSDPPTGTYDIVVTGSTSMELWAAAQAWNDVNQASPISDTDGSSGTGTTASVPALTAGGSDVCVAIVGFYSGGDVAATESDTLIIEEDSNVNQTGWAYQRGDGNLSWGLSASATWSSHGMTIVHDAGGAAADQLQPWQQKGGMGVMVAS